MNDNETKKPTAETPEETERDLAGLADRLEEMHEAEGVFGEVLTDAKMDDIAGGGFITSPELIKQYIQCQNCPKVFEWTTKTTVNLTPGPHLDGKQTVITVEPPKYCPDCLREYPYLRFPYLASKLGSK